MLVAGGRKNSTHRLKAGAWQAGASRFCMPCCCCLFSFIFLLSDLAAFSAGTELQIAAESMAPWEEFKFLGLACKVKGTRKTSKDVQVDQGEKNKATGCEDTYMFYFKWNATGDQVYEGEVEKFMRTGETRPCSTEMPSQPPSWMYGTLTNCWKPASDD